MRPLPLIAEKHQSAGGFRKYALRAENNCSSRYFFRPFSELHWDWIDFLHEVQFSAAIEAAHFPAAFRMLLSQHSKEGAPFMGTALAAYRQCIGPRLSAIFN